MLLCRYKSLEFLAFLNITFHILHNKNQIYTIKKEICEEKLALSIRDKCSQRNLSVPTIIKTKNYEKDPHFPFGLGSYRQKSHGMFAHTHGYIAGSTQAI